MTKSQNGPTQTTNTMKTNIILPLMTIALLLAACGKNEQPAGNPATRDKAATAALLRQIDIDPNEVLYTIRKGEKVAIRWDADFSDFKGIGILRNTVDDLNNSRPVANLPASSTEYVDTVPNARVYWYWIAVESEGNSIKRIGPVRARADTSKTGKYASGAKDVTLLAQRTQSAVVVAWELPGGKYKEIVIRRRDKNELPYGRDQRARLVVHSTSERSGDLVDTLPEPNKDYWYWLEATREDGAIITRGPVKAKFESTDAPKGQSTSQPKKSLPKSKQKKITPKKGKAQG